MSDDEAIATMTSATTVTSTANNDKKDATPSRKLNIAIVGNLDNGKSTFLNAWLGGDCSEASEEDCTKVLYNFHIVDGVDDKEEGGKKSSFEEIHKETIQINKMKDSEIEEKEKDFFVTLPKPLFPLHHGLSLTISDFPGLNSSQYYKDVLSKRNYDLIILIVDASVAARSEFHKQEELMEVIHEILYKEQGNDSPPLVIGVNKVDDDCDEDTKKRSDKVFKCIGNIFKVSSREEALNKALALGEDNTHHPDWMFPVVVKMCAKQSLFYRKCLNINSKDELRKMGKSCVKKMAEVGMNFDERRGLSEEELFERVYQLCSEGGFEEMLDETGFNKMVSAIKLCVAGSNRQGQIICRQLRRELRQLKVNADNGFVDTFEQNLLQQLDFSTKMEGDKNFDIFVALANDYKLQVIAKFKENPKASPKIMKCFEEIIKFEDCVAQKLCLDHNDTLENDIENWASDFLTDLLKHYVNVIAFKGKELIQRHRPSIERSSSGWCELSDENWKENLKLVCEQLSIPCVVEHCRDETRRIQDLLDDGLLNGDSDEGACVVDFKWFEVVQKFKLFLDKQNDKKIDEKVNSATSRLMSKQIVDIEEVIEAKVKKVEQRMEEQRKEIAELKSEIRELKEENGNSQRGVKRALDEILSFQKEAGSHKSPAPPFEDLTNKGENTE